MKYSNLLLVILFLEEINSAVMEKTSRWALFLTILDGLNTVVESQLITDPISSPTNDFV